MKFHGDDPDRVYLTVADIEARMAELRAQMAERGTNDAATDLVKEHRDLVRERNALRDGKKRELR